MSPRAKLWDALTRRRGNRMWDGVIRGTGVLGLLGLVLAIAIPETGPLIGFMIVTLWITGPLSPLMPVGYETVLMLMGRVYPPLLISVLGMAGTLYVEFLSYYLYGRIADLQVLRGLRESRWVARLHTHFERRPFLWIWFLAWSPLPFWIARFLAPMVGYPVGRYLLAFVLGRFPKIWLFAALGLYLNVSDRLLVVILVGSLVLVAGFRAFQRFYPGVQTSKRDLELSQEKAS